MATCKDCICFDILCRDILQEDELKLCESFKNKADFVEVVRCEKCKYGDVGIIEKTKDGQERWGCYCNIEKVVHSLDWYCPLGIRKEEG